MGRKEILIIGGDRRQYYMAEYLLKKGCEVAAFGEVFTEMKGALTKLRTVGEVRDYLGKAGMAVVLPVPVTTDGETVKGTDGEIRLEEICPYMKDNEKLYGGNIPVELRCMCEIKQGQCMDFMKSEQVASLNAVPTAEGSIAEAICMGEGQLSGSRCLVVGFGRCGAVLADKLKCLGAVVTVMERNGKKRARAAAYGLVSCGFDGSREHLKTYDYIFNTVPVQILDADFLAGCKRDVTIIDIASAPGGVDYEAAKQMGRKAKLCPGLPGKYAPKTAGEILAEELIRMETLRQEPQ